MSFGQSAKSFWKATPWEFWSLYNKQFAEQIDMAPMTKERFEELREKHERGHNS